MWVRVPPRVPMRATTKRACPNLNPTRRGPQNEDREIRTPNLLIWSQTRYRCAISPVQNRARRDTSDTNNKKRLNTAPLMQTNSPHWGLNPGPSVYKTDALPLSYRGVAFRRRGGIEPLHVSMPRELKSRPGTSPTHPGCSRAAPMRRPIAFLALRGIGCVRNRQRGDSNPCGQSPMDF